MSVKRRTTAIILRIPFSLIADKLDCPFKLVSLYVIWNICIKLKWTGGPPVPPRRFIKENIDRVMCKKIKLFLFTIFFYIWQSIPPTTASQSTPISTGFFDLNSDNVVEQQRLLGKLHKLIDHNNFVTN